MELLELNALVRETVGNGPARALRRQGRIPAILYGPDIDSIKLSVNNKEFEQTLKNTKSGQLLVNLLVQNGERVQHPAMLTELQTNPISGDLLHADFYQIALDRKINVMTPLNIIGKSKGVEAGGFLQVIRRELEVSCLPNLVPESIEVDITDLDVGDSLHVDEIQVGENIEIVADANFTVVTVTAPTKEDVGEAEELEEELEEGEEGEEDEEGEEEE